MRVQGCCFTNPNLLLFCRSRCRSRCLSFLLLILKRTTRKSYFYVNSFILVTRRAEILSSLHGDPGGVSQSRRGKRTVLWNIHRAVSLALKTASGSSRMKYDMNVVGKVTKNRRWFSDFWEASHPLMYWNKEMQTFSPNVICDNLRQSWFWIPRCWFRNSGTRFRIPCQWYLDSRFQSTLAGFRIPDS